MVSVEVKDPLMLVVNAFRKTVDNVIKCVSIATMSPMINPKLILEVFVTVMDPLMHVVYA